MEIRDLFSGMTHQGTYCWDSSFIISTALIV